MMSELPEQKGWWREVTFYQWMVLIVASAGWIFDIYESQIFALTHGNMLGELLHVANNAAIVNQYFDTINSCFLIGGAIGGILFGMIADRYGRGRSMVLSILVYAVFSALTAAAQTVGQVAVLRFLVAMGTGGEWAVAAALVAEVFPPRARAHASGIFHASSVLGTFAAWAGSHFVGTNWRMAFLFGVVPALLVFLVRVYVKEPNKRLAGESAKSGMERRGFSEFWSNALYRRYALLGLLLAGIGLIGFWGVYVAGLDLARDFLIHHGVSPKDAEPRAKTAYGVYQLIGGGIGLFTMGPLCAWLGRKKAFVLMQFGALGATALLCFLPSTFAMLLLLLAVMGFFVNGMHAGYAVWFPELFPARLRATGAGICFNGARLLAAPGLALSGWLKGRMALPQAVMILAMVYVGGIVVAMLLPETQGKVLEE
ncbi:MAG TPA: MFS transporter [Tepidisphaeraceae bacterium]|jgi:MFS family permease|nr:MFS transporter [Tepidisphaeraceae bacterium]